MPRISVPALKPPRTWPKKRCFMLSKRDRAEAFAAPAVTPLSASVMPVASSAACRLRWITLKARAKRS